MIDRKDVRVTVHEEGGSVFMRLEFNGKAGWALLAPTGEVTPQEPEREDELEEAYQASRTQTDTAP